MRSLPQSLAVAVTAWSAAIPDGIRDSALVAIGFVGIDTLSGLYLAAKRGQAASRKMRDKLAAKCLQYLQIAGLFGGAALLARRWEALGAGLGCIVAIEAISILENLAQLENMGGAPLGAIRPLLKRVSRSLATEALDPSHRSHESHKSHSSHTKTTNTKGGENR